MHRFLTRGLVALSTGWVAWGGSSVIAADPPAATSSSTESRSFFDRLNPFSVDQAPVEPGPRLRKPVGPLSSETMVSVLQAEKDAYTRRLDVCHRLREIAINQGDEALEAKVNELEKQAMATYQARVSRLGVKTGGPLPRLPTATATETVTSLDRALGSGVAVNPLTTGKKSATSEKTTTAKVNQFKEVGQ